MSYLEKAKELEAKGIIDNVQTITSLAIAEEIADLKWAVVRLVEAVKEATHGGSISVPGATGVPGAPKTVPHQTPAPQGHEDDDGGSS